MKNLLYIVVLISGIEVLAQDPVARYTFVENDTDQSESITYINSRETGAEVLLNASGVSGSADMAEASEGVKEDVNIHNRSFPSSEAVGMNLMEPIPKITSFTPVSGPVGTSVTITGTDFDPTPANNIVFFGATKATVSAASATELTVTVPSGFTHQPISVLSNGLIAYSAAPFTVTFAGAGITLDSFEREDYTTVKTAPRSVAIADLDGDGTADLAVANEGDNTISILKNSGTNSGIINYTPDIILVTDGNPISIATGDLDGDGKPDLVVTNRGSSSVSVFRNTTLADGTISFTAKTDFTTGIEPRTVSIGDLDGDGRADLAVANQGSGSVSVLRNTSTGMGVIGFAAKTDLLTGGTPNTVAIGDLDGDGKADLAVSNQASGMVSVFRNIGTGSGTIDYAIKEDHQAGAAPASVAIGDLDGDSRADLVVANLNGNSVSVFRNTSTSGSISYTIGVTFETGEDPIFVTMGDLDGDGKADLAVANETSNTVSVLRNISTGTTINFADKVDFETGTESGPYAVATGDLDGDGLTDFVVPRWKSNQISVFRHASFVNSPPTDMSLSSLSISENENIGTEVGTFSTTDVDADSHLYSLTSGAGENDNGSFSISGNQLLSKEVFNAEFKSSYTIRVETNDQNGGVYEEAFAITINNVAEIGDSQFSNLTPSEHLIGSGNLTVVVEVVDPDMVDKVEINYKKIGGTEYTTKPMTDEGSNNRFTFSMAENELDNTGVQYSFESTDANFETTQSSVFFTCSLVADDAETLPSISAGTTIQDYSIVAFPYHSPDAGLLTDDLGSYNTINWRLLRYTSGEYQDLNQFNSISPGSGYWLIVKDATTIDVGGRSVAVTENGVFTMDLSAGYNLIGNPFHGTLNWSQVVQHNLDNGIIQSGDINSGNISSLDGWSKTWTDRNTLNEFEGAFVNMVNAVADFEIPISALNGSGGRNAAVERKPQHVSIDDAEWELRLFFNTPSYSYSMGGIGMHPEALDEDDDFDKDLLPKFLLYLDMQFADGNTRSFKQSDHYKVWDFTLPNNLEETTFDLTWDIPVSFGKTIILVDGASKRIYDLKETHRITLSNDPGAKHQLYYGDKETIFNRIDLPFDALYSIYPNPVQNEMTLQMYSDKDKSAFVELISINGKKIPLGHIQLTKGISSGKINLNGNSVPEGMYFVKVDDRILTKILKK